MLWLYCVLGLFLNIVWCVIFGVWGKVVSVLVDKLFLGMSCMFVVIVERVKGSKVVSVSMCLIFLE